MDSTMFQPHYTVGCQGIGLPMTSSLTPYGSSNVFPASFPTPAGYSGPTLSRGLLGVSSTWITSMQPFAFQPVDLQFSPSLSYTQSEVLRRPNGFDLLANECSDSRRNRRRRVLAKRHISDTQKETSEQLKSTSSVVAPPSNISRTIELGYKVNTAQSPAVRTDAITERISSGTKLAKEGLSHGAETKGVHPLYCRPCRVKLNAAAQAKQHFEGKAHARKTALQKFCFRQHHNPSDVNKIAATIRSSNSSISDSSVTHETIVSDDNDSTTGSLTQIGMSHHEAADLDGDGDVIMRDYDSFEIVIEKEHSRISEATTTTTTTTTCDDTVVSSSTSDITRRYDLAGSDAVFGIGTEVRCTAVTATNVGETITHDVGVDDGRNVSDVICSSDNMVDTEVTADNSDICKFKKEQKAPSGSIIMSAAEIEEGARIFISNDAKLSKESPPGQPLHADDLSLFAVDDLFVVHGGSLQPPAPVTESLSGNKTTVSTGYEQPQDTHDVEMDDGSMSPEVYCVICGISFNSDKQSRQHYAGKLHAKKRRLDNHLQRCAARKEEKVYGKRRRGGEGGVREGLNKIGRRWRRPLCAKLPIVLRGDMVYYRPTTQSPW